MKDKHTSLHLHSTWRSVIGGPYTFVTIRKITPRMLVRGVERRPRYVHVTVVNTDIAAVLTEADFRQSFVEVRNR